MPYIKFLSLFQKFGSNSSVASNSGIVIHDLSWEFVSRSSLHYFLWKLQAVPKLFCIDCSYH